MESKQRKMNIFRFNEAIQGKAKLFLKEKCGILGFAMGKDYYPSIPDEEIQKVNFGTKKKT